MARRANLRPTPSHGGMRIVDAQAARFGEFDDVQLMGLVEGEWPERPRRNIFYPQALLAQLEPSRPDRVEIHQERDLLRSRTRGVSRPARPGAIAHAAVDVRPRSRRRGRAVVVYRGRCRVRLATETAARRDQARACSRYEVLIANPARHRIGVGRGPRRVTRSGIARDSKGKPARGRCRVSASAGSSAI